MHLRHRMAFAAVVVVAALATVSCGGGSAGPPAPTEFRLAGSASGLAGTVVLRNGGDELSVAADGAFAFARPVAVGAPYAVTIASEPFGRRCRLTDATGTATAAMPVVRLECVVDPGAFFAPLSVLALPGTGGAMATGGLHVVRSTRPETGALRVTSGVFETIGYALRYSRGADGRWQAGAPARFAYFAPDADGRLRAWAIDLSPAATAPTPRRVGNLAISRESSVSPLPGPLAFATAADSTCGTVPLLRDLRDPDSLLLVVRRPGFRPRCDDGGAEGGVVVMRLGDGPDVAPREVPTVRDVIAVYRDDGTLAGLVARTPDGAAAFYADENFANPQRFATGVAGLWRLDAAARSALDSAFVGVAPLPGPVLVGVAFRDGRFAVHRVGEGAAGTGPLYEFRGWPAGTAVDGEHVYVGDRVDSAAGSEFAVARLPRTAGPATVPYRRPEPASRTTFLGEAAHGRVALLDFVVPAAAPLRDVGLALLRVDAPGAPVEIARYEGLPEVQATDDGWLVTVVKDVTPSGSFQPLRAEYSTEVRGPDGAPLQARRERSAFAYTAPGLVVQVRDATTAVGLGGGVLVRWAGSSGAPTLRPFVRADGASFGLPDWMSYPPSVVRLAEGHAATQVSGTGYDEAVALDLERGRAIPIRPPDTATAWIWRPF